MNTHSEQQIKGHLMIVDDDPVGSGMLAMSLSKKGFEVVEVESGEACLEKVATEVPDVVLLDIEMPGIDGHETCRRIRAGAATRELPVIFLSSRDGLEDRIQAYDSGADDFIAKPFDPEEVHRKVNIALRIRSIHEKLLTEKTAANSTTMTALNSMGETGIVLKFTRDSLSCKSLHSLAMLAVNSLKSYGIESHAQVRSAFGTLTVKPDGPASPLEASVIDQSQNQGRIFQFKRRMIVNYDSMSILVMDMPLEDPDAAGRIRDYVAMVCETGDAAVDNIVLRLEANARAEELQRLTAATKAAIENLRVRYQTQQIDTRVELDRMVHNLEHMYSSLGLVNSQEMSISNVVRNAQNEVMHHFEQGAVDDEAFNAILEGLASAANYKVEVEAEEGGPASASSIDLW